MNTITQLALITLIMTISICLGPIAILLMFCLIVVGKYAYVWLLNCKRNKIGWWAE